MNTFRIGYKCFYRETSDHNSDYIEAENEAAALKIFAKEHKISGASRQRPEKWVWWEGEWYCEFRALELVTVIPCLHCGGNGEVAVNMTASLK